MGIRAIIAFLVSLLAAMSVTSLSLAQNDAPTVEQRGIPVVDISESTPEVNLAAHLSLITLPAGAAVNPDTLWGAPVKAPAGEGPELVTLESEVTVAGRATLRAGRSKAIYFVQVPSSRIDYVQLWTRVAGGSWHSAEAGDTVPLAQWPFYGQFPAFAIPMVDQDVEMIVVLHTEGAMGVPLLIKTEKAYQEGRLRQANLTGFVTGMGLMVCVVCLISAATQRTRAGWVVLLFSAWLVLTVICLNGYGPIWILPDLPGLNDKSKAFTVVVLAGLSAWTISELLDRLEGRAVTRYAGPAALALALVYALVQALVLPSAWRGNGTIVSAGVACVLAIGMCVVSARNGGRHVGWIAGSVGALAFASVLGRLRLPLIEGLDWAAATSSLALFASALLMRHALFTRVRYGRDVMGRAAISANRDPLTAMLSYTGLEQAHAEAQLSEAAGLGNAAVMLFLLPGLDRTGAEHGFVLTERALVRFAATLQERLGQDWAIGRLSKTRFAAICMRERTPEQLIELATLVLSRSSRQSELPGAIADFDLRIACRARGLQGLPFAELWRQTDEVARSLEGGRRIAMI